LDIIKNKDPNLERLALNTLNKILNMISIESNNVFMYAKSEPFIEIIQ
jgi:hypothetical protein